MINIIQMVSSMGTDPQEYVICAMEVLSISLSTMCNWSKIFHWQYALNHLSLSLVFLLTVLYLVYYQSKSNIYIENLSMAFYNSNVYIYSNSTMFVLCTCRDWPKGTTAEWLGHFSQNLLTETRAALAFWELFWSISITKCLGDKSSCNGFPRLLMYFPINFD